MIVPTSCGSERLLHELHGFRPNLVHLCSVLSSAPWRSALQRLQMVKQRGSREMTTRSMHLGGWGGNLVDVDGIGRMGVGVEGRVCL